MKLILLDAAEQDMMRAAERYEQETPGLGTEFLHAIASAVSLLRRQRFLGRIFAGIALPDTREYVMPRFPYSLIYRVSNTGLTVLAVSHPCTYKAVAAWHGILESRMPSSCSAPVQNLYTC